MLLSFSNLRESFRGIINNIASRIWFNEISKEGSKRDIVKHELRVTSYDLKA